jgi:hypothetical protein
LAADKHVMAPNQKSKDPNGETGGSDKLVAEKWLARKTRNQLTNHPHAGQDHNVNRGVRIEPEEVLKKQRVTAESWIEKPDPEGTLQGHQS